MAKPGRQEVTSPPVAAKGARVLEKNKAPWVEMTLAARAMSSRLMRHAYRPGMIVAISVALIALLYPSFASRTGAASANCNLPPKTADFNDIPSSYDAVDGTDVLDLLQNFLVPAPPSQYDLNGDGVVDARDFGIERLLIWNGACGNSPTPMSPPPTTAGGTISYSCIAGCTNGFVPVNQPFTIEVALTAPPVSSPYVGFNSALLYDPSKVTFDGITFPAGSPLPSVGFNLLAPSSNLPADGHTGTGTAPLLAGPLAGLSAGLVFNGLPWGIPPTIATGPLVDYHFTAGPLASLTAVHLVAPPEVASVLLGAPDLSGSYGTETFDASNHQPQTSTITCVGTCGAALGFASSLQLNVVGSVGGFAEQPGVAARPMASRISGDHTTVLVLGGLALALVAAIVADGWYVRRKRAR